MHLRELGPLEDALGVVFRQKDLLNLALAHSSFIHENPDVLPLSNERLEFLGDAVLGTATAGELYERYPDWPEGELTLARSALVRGETLAVAAEGLGLGEQLYMGRGEEAGGGRKRAANLAAAFEAVVGALFLDQGYEVARDFVLRVLSDELSDLALSGVPGNAKSVLQEALQARGQPAPSYEIVEVAGQEHARQFTAEVTVDGEVAGRGTGARKAQAESAAAAEALKALGE